MSILVCRVKSPLSQVTDERVKDYLSCVQDELKEELRLVEMDELDKVPFGLVYVASGGSEGIFLEKYLKLAERPLYILTSGEIRWPLRWKFFPTFRRTGIMARSFTAA